MVSSNRQTILGIVIALLLLLLLEGFSRILKTVNDDVVALRPQWLQYSADLGWEKRPNYSGLMPNESRTLEPTRYERHFDAEGFLTIDSSQVADPTQRKILTVGDSNTFGWGVPTEMTYSEVLDDLLPDYSVINLGVTGYSSFQGGKVLERSVERFSPALVVVSFNFNDRRLVLSAADVDSDDKFARDTASRRLASLKEIVYLNRLLEFGLAKVGVGRVASHASGIADLRTVAPRVSPEQYKANLARMARLCRERGIPLVFVVLRDNPVQTAYLDVGVDLFRRGLLDAAEQNLKVVARSQGWFTALGKKYLVQLYQGRGESAAADVAAQESVVNLMNGDKPIHLDWEYNDIMRAVAAEFGVTLVEAGEAMRQDPSFYVDYCHFDERGHRLLAGMLKPVIDTLLVPESQHSTPLR